MPTKNPMRPIDLSHVYKARKEQYAEGKPCLNIPPPQAISSLYGSVQLKAQIALAKAMLALPAEAVPVWYLEEKLEATREDIEQVASNCGLALIYIDAKKFGGKTKGLRRVIELDHEGIKKWLKKVRRYVEKRMTAE